MGKFRDDKYEIMKSYFDSCCGHHLLDVLESFTHGIGWGISEIVLVFSDDPDENDPNQLREFPELINFEGVGFFSEHYPEPLLLSYEEFYENLKLYVDKYICTKTKKYQEEVIQYLELIRNRYCTK